METDTPVRAKWDAQISSVFITKHSWELKTKKQTNKQKTTQPLSEIQLRENNFPLLPTLKTWGTKGGSINGEAMRLTDPLSSSTTRDPLKTAPASTSTERLGRI